MGTWGIDRFLDALERRVAKLPPLPTPEERDAGLILTVRHPGSARSEEEVGGWNLQAPIVSDPEDPGLHIAIHFEPWEHPHFVAEDDAPALAPAYHAPDADPLPHGPPRLTLTVSGRVWMCQHCGYEWAYEGPSDHLGPCPSCCGRWGWALTPPGRGGGSPITW